MNDDTCRMTTSGFVFFLCALLTPLSFALGHVVSYQEMRQAHFGAIQKLSMCGDWRSAERSGEIMGEFRLIEVFLYGQDMLFVDMVKVNKAQTAQVVEHGFTISQINNDHAEYDFASVNCRDNGPGKIHITVHSKIADNEKPVVIEIDIDAKTRTYRYTEHPRKNGRGGKPQ